MQLPRLAMNFLCAYCWCVGHTLLSVITKLCCSHVRTVTCRCSQLLYCIFCLAHVFVLWMINIYKIQFSVPWKKEIPCCWNTCCRSWVSQSVCTLALNILGLQFFGLMCSSSSSCWGGLWRKKSWDVATVHTLTCSSCCQIPAFFSGEPWFHSLCMLF